MNAFAAQPVNINKSLTCLLYSNAMILKADITILHFSDFSLVLLSEEYTTWQSSSERNAPDEGT